MNVFDDLGLIDRVVDETLQLERELGVPRAREATARIRQNTGEEYYKEWIDIDALESRMRAIPESWIELELGLKQCFDNKFRPMIKGFSDVAADDLIEELTENMRRFVIRNCYKLVRKQLWLR